MFEWIKTIYTKPKYEMSMLDNLAAVGIAFGIATVGVLLVWGICGIIDFIKRKRQK
jgi:ABC-type branched-subunit amino acid transport system permease subunit